MAAVPDEALLPLVVCADDFGLSAEINSGVQALASSSAISAASCLVNAPACTADAVGRLVASGVDVGLHLNFTDGQPLSDVLRRRWHRFPPLAVLIALAHARLLPVAEIREECEAQFVRFRALAGRGPCFLDGHQHVHHLPGIRGAWLPLLQAQSPSAYVRSTAELPGPGSGLKRWVLRHTGGVALGQALRGAGIHAASPLIGSYGFKHDDYRVLVRQWLRAVRDCNGAALLYCHPGQAAAQPLPFDPIGAARQREWQYLSSQSWISDLAEAGLRIARGSEVFSSGMHAFHPCAGDVN